MTKVHMGLNFECLILKLNFFEVPYTRRIGIVQVFVAVFVFKFCLNIVPKTTCSKTSFLELTIVASEIKDRHKKIAE